MPSLLKPDAWCPVCGRGLIMVARTTGPGDKGRLDFTHLPQEQPEDCHLVGRVETIDRIHGRVTR